MRFGGPVRQPGFECDFPAQFDSTVDVVQRRCSATLSSAGWYRVCKTANVSGSILKFYINTVNVAETHEIDFMVSGTATNFTNESSVCTHVFIDKIRSTYNGADLFIDVHYNTSNSNTVKVGFEAYGKASETDVTLSSGLTSVADSPSGETVVVTYNFHADISSTVKDISTAVTLNSGYDPLQKWIYVHDGMVDMFIETYFANYVADYEYIIGTITSPYRPNHLIAATGHTADSNFNPKGLVNFIVYTNGNLGVRVNNTVGNYVIVHATYSIF